jgi:hypothetical protein
MRKPTTEEALALQAKHEALRKAQELMADLSGTAEGRQALQDAAWWVFSHSEDAKIGKKGPPPQGAGSLWS